MSTRRSARVEREEAAERLLGQQLGAPPRLLHSLVAERVQKIPIDCISRSPAQPRKRFDAAGIEQLAASIRCVGVGLRQPIEVDQPDPDAEAYVLTYGERRLRAFELLANSDPAPGFNPRDFVRIPALVRAIDPAMRPAVAIVENLHRAGLTPRETAEGLVALKAVVGTWEAVATAVGLDVARVKRLASLAGKAAIVGALDRGDITQNQAFALRAVRDPELLEAAVAGVSGCDETTTRIVVRELEAQDEGLPAADRVAVAMARAVGVNAEQGTPDATDDAPPPNLAPTGAPQPAGGTPTAAFVVPAETALHAVMRQRRVSPERFAEALQRTCEQTGIWPTQPPD